MASDHNFALGTIWIAFGAQFDFFEKKKYFEIRNVWSREDQKLTYAQFVHRILHTPLVKIGRFWRFQHFWTQKIFEIL